MTKTFGLVIFPDAEELDFVGPFEVFGMFSQAIDKDWQVVTVAETAAPVRCAKGLVVVPDRTFDDCPPLDVLLVPGGIGARRSIDNARLMDFVRRAGASARWVTSVCTGSFVLAAAGFLEGRKASTYWAARDRLHQDYGIDVVEARWVVDGNVITAGGVSAGIDMALYLIGALTDVETARKVQQLIEYYPEPPYAGAAVAAGEKGAS